MNVILSDLLKYLSTPALLLSMAIWILYQTFRFGKFSERFDNLCKQINKLLGEFQTTKKDVGIIKTILISKFGVEAELFSTTTPLTLTAKGKKLLEKSGFREMYKQEKDYFLNTIREKNPKTAAEIDKVAKEIMFALEDEEKLSKFKETAFESGVELPLLLQVCAIYLRNKAIKELLS